MYLVFLIRSHKNDFGYHSIVIEIFSSSYNERLGTFMLGSKIVIRIMIIYFFLPRFRPNCFKVFFKTRFSMSISFRHQKEYACGIKSTKIYFYSLLLTLLYIKDGKSIEFSYIQIYQVIKSLFLTNSKNPTYNKITKEVFF